MVRTFRPCYKRSVSEGLVQDAGHRFVQVPTIICRALRPENVRDDLYTSRGTRTFWLLGRCFRHTPRRQVQLLVREQRSTKLPSTCCAGRATTRGVISEVALTMEYSKAYEAYRDDVETLVASST